MSSDCLPKFSPSAPSILFRDDESAVPFGDIRGRVQSILLVDSGNEVVDQLAGWLSKSGVRVTTVRTAAAAIRQYVHHPADLLLVNVDLPDQSGWLFVAKLRLTHTDASVLLFRTRALPDDARRAASIGATGFLDLAEVAVQLAAPAMLPVDLYRRGPSAA